MEKKKLLLVAVSVGVVLLIIIGVPLMIISPRQAAQAGWQTVPQANLGPDPFARPDWQQVQPAWPQEDLRQAPPPAWLPGPDAPTQPPAQIPAPTPLPVTPSVPADDAPRVTTITVPTPRTAAVPEAPPAAARPAQPRPAPAQVAQARPTPARPQATPAPAARPAPAAQATRNNFWIQAGAFSSKVRAELVKESLEAKGIASIIENRNINGRTYYRVRVGPYLSENEANYWLPLVRSIDGFALSQVRVSPAPIN